MSDESKGKPVNFGEPVVLQEPKKEESKGGTGWAAPLFLIGGMMAVILILAIAPGGTSEPPGTIATYAPGIPTPTTSLPQTGANTFACQPGIQVGSPARVVSSAVRIRQSPGYVGKNDAADTIHYLESGDVVNIIGGPTSQDGLCWWNVDYQGIKGWTADHSRTGALLLTAGP
jgi:hypothetical protein